MKRKLLAFILGGVLCTMSAYAVENPFSDISSTDDIAQAVLWAYELEITTGTSDTTFDPDSTCTRGHVVTFLWCAKGSPSPTTTETDFTDLTQDWYYDAVLWAVEGGITTGTSDTTFDPDSTCTSAEIVTFLYRAMGEPEYTTVSDLATSAPSYYADAISWADETGLLDGMDFNYTDFSPRSDVVTYLYRDADSPEIVIDEPSEPLEEEPAVEEAIATTFAYTMPQVDAPSTDGTLSAEYFEQMILYMLVNDVESFSCVFYDTSSDALENAGIDDIAYEAFVLIKSYYHELGCYYDSINYLRSWGADATKITYTITLYNKSISAPYLGTDTNGNPIANPDFSNDTIYSYTEGFLDKIDELTASFYADGSIKADDSDYTKALYFYKWCIANISYDMTYSTLGYTGYGALFNGTSVCQGYTAVFNALCNASGIECIGIAGEAGGDSHIWNYANLDGTWYYIDTTFGDPIGGSYDESYFAMTYDQLIRTHVIDDIFQ